MVGIRDTYNVSYVGQTDFGSLSDYIRSIYTVTTGHLLTEINSFQDYFFVCFCQSVNNGRYIESLLDVLEKEGIKYNISRVLGIFIGSIFRILFAVVII